MRSLVELSAWDRLFRRIVWRQMGDIRGKDMLDFGSGEGMTADHFAADNHVTAIEPWEEMLKDRWADNDYIQIKGNISEVKKLPDSSFDYIVCHNVLEYTDDKEKIIKELARVLRHGGTMSIVKHNRYGRVMQMAVLLDDIERANILLDGKNSTASKFGEIRYYDDGDIARWSSDLLPVKTYGIRVFWDLQQDQEKHGDEDWQERMARLEMRVSELDEFKNIAFFHHILLNKE